MIGGTIDYLAFHEVLNWRHSDPDKLAALFENRLVFLGVVTRWEDRKLLPLALFADALDQGSEHQPGVVVHMQALRSYLNQGLITPGRGGLNWLCA